MLDRQLSTHTSKPLSCSICGKVVVVGGLKMLARVPVPTIMSTGPSGRLGCGCEVFEV